MTSTRGHRQRDVGVPKISSISTRRTKFSLNVDAKPKTILIAKELESGDKGKMNYLVRHYKDVFTWSFEDMKGLDPAFYQH